MAEPASQPPDLSKQPLEELLDAAHKAMKEEGQPDAVRELAQEIDDVRRRYLAERG